MRVDTLAQTTEPVRLAELVASFSLASDLGTGMPMEWAVRSCVIAIRLGEAVGHDEAVLRDVYYLSLLALIGCTADSHRFAEMVGDEMAITGGEGQTVDWGNNRAAMSYLVRRVGSGQPPLRRARMLAGFLAAGKGIWVEGARAHCEVAQQLSERLGIAASIQPLLFQVFERWDGRGRPNGIKGEEIALPVRVGQLARDVEIFHRLHGLDAAVAMARDRSGSSHDPRLVEQFCRHAATICAGLSIDSAWETVLAIEPGPRPVMAGDQLDAAAPSVADFADLKLPFTVGHSRGVAALAEAAGRRCRLPEGDLVAIRRAGLMHDLGRVGVSASIWCKPGTLAEGEWERVRLHPYYTERILARSKALAPLGLLAAQHHERVDGSGYHRGLAGGMIPPIARLLAAADVYQALTEERPYRPARAPEQAAAEVEREVKNGRLDAEAANAVLAAAGHRVRPARKEMAAGLSEREVEVLRLLARGLSNREMAGQLFISKETVNHHVRHIYDKLGVSTRPAATLFAVQHGLLEPVLPIR
jgi:HD-GYP domain-containing protein (c-di-GMP phosphodiesterase class II)